MRGVGISGVLGTGKRELADAFSCQTDFELLSFDNEDVLRRTRAKFTTAGVIDEYRNVLSQLESSYIHASNRFVTDMTPIDVMAELYSTFTWVNRPSDEANQQVNEAWDDACRICSKYLSVLMYIQPSGMGARQEHLNALGAGLIHTRLVNSIDTKMFTIRRNLLDLDKRLAALKNFVFEQYVEESPYANTSSLHH